MLIKTDSNTINHNTDLEHSEVYLNDLNSHLMALKTYAADAEYVSDGAIEMG